MLPLDKVKEGTRVTLSEKSSYYNLSNADYSNPINIEGVITEVFVDLPKSQEDADEQEWEWETEHGLYVMWDNYIENTYSPFDLDLVITKLYPDE